MLIRRRVDKTAQEILKGKKGEKDRGNQEKAADKSAVQEFLELKRQHILCSFSVSAFLELKKLGTWS